MGVAAHHSPVPVARAVLVHYARTPLSWLPTRLARWGRAMTMGVAANEVGRGNDGWGQLLTTYVARALTDILAANKVSKVGEMTMGVAAHHSQG